MNQSAKLFKKLGDRVATQWRDHHLDPLAFPSLAAEALADARVHETITLEDVVALALEPEAVATVPITSDFGDAAVTVHKGSRFTIEVLVWTEGTTQIHQHGFSGAFAVAAGGSFHGTYSFEATERINAAMLYGDLQLAHTEILSVGQVRKIGSGSAFIHNLFHLEAPSITVVVRTTDERGIEPQYSYLPPGLADDPFFRDPLALSQTRCLSMLLSLEHPEAEANLRNYARDNDLHSVYRAFDALGPVLSNKGLLEQAFGWARERHGAKVDWLRAAFDEDARRSKVMGQRRVTRDPELRYFLALLLNAPSAPKIHELIRVRFPEDDPAEKCIGWIAKLLDAHGADFGDSLLDVIRFAQEDPSHDYVMGRLGEIYDVEDVRGQSVIIRELCSELRHNLVLRPLFYTG